VELSCDEGLEIFGVPAVINHVVLSLIDNAQKSGATRVAIKALAESTHVALEVQDNGPGIPPELRERVFDPFFTRRPVGEGSGLGLFLCRNALSEIGGSIEVGPSASGARVIVQLPTPPTGAALFRPSQASRERPSAPPGR
jgi:signal transduction histidine kinase